MEPAILSMTRLAKLAGVHVSTVSRAMRSDPTIPEATRTRIRALAGTLGYRPDPALSALSAYRRTASVRRHEEIIAVLESNADPRDAPANRVYLEGARQRAGELGYKLEVFSCQPGRLTGPRLAGILQTRGIRGVLVLPLATGLNSLDLPWEQLSTVAIGYKLATPRLHRISVTHFDAMADAVMRVHALGYRRPGLVLLHDGARTEGGQPRQVNVLYEGGYAFAMRRRFPKMRIPIHRITTPAGFLRWCRRYRPDVIISQSPEIESVLRGERLPEAPGLVFTMVDGDSRLTGILQNSEYVGRHAIDTLVGILYRHETGAPNVPTTVQVHTTWQVGTTAPART